jgi:dimethylhistidine N-methyltransferase
MKILDLAPRSDTLKDDVLTGLGKSPKELPCKYFYDRAGSRLFDQICELEEYYPTRTELAIMDRHVDEMAGCLGPRCLLIEYGSGSGRKTEILLAALIDPVAYVPIEISPQPLAASVRRLAQRFPKLEVLGVNADYTASYEVPSSRQPPRRRAIYFPGSTIGNFEADEARRFLEHAATTVGPGGALLIGADLVKERSILLDAYDDSLGVTAQFNKNLLVRINRELGADFDVDEFAHRAIYNETAHRIEMHLESLCTQTVALDGHEFRFGRGERIRTEYSHKYTLGGFTDMADRAGFRVEKVWIDEKELFSVQYLVAVYA